MDDKELMVFSERLVTPNFKLFIENVKPTIDQKLFKLLQENSKFSLDRWRLVGGLEKKTSTLLKADADIVVFHNEHNLSQMDILDDFQDILLINTSLKEEDINISTNDVMQFTLDGIDVDLLVAENHAGKMQGRDTIQEQRENSLIRMKQYGSYTDKKSVVRLSFQLTESSVDFMKKKSKFVHDVARLGKYWSQIILFKHHVHGKSLIFELLATKAALLEEYNFKIPSMNSAFKRFLTMVCYMKSQYIIFDDYYKRSDVPSEILKQRPLLLDPVNPYNNLLDLEKKPALLSLFKTYQFAAGTVLTMLGKGCKDIELVFCPQPLLYELRRKENWILPKEGTYLVGIRELKDFSSNVLKKDTKGMPNILMPSLVIRDPRGKSLEGDFREVLYAMAGVVHNLIFQKTIQNKSQHDISDEEIRDFTTEFIDKMDNVKRNWVISYKNHHTKGVSLIIPFSKCCTVPPKILCISFDFYVIDIRITP